MKYLYLIIYKCDNEGRIERPVITLNEKIENVEIHEIENAIGKIKEYGKGTILKYKFLKEKEN